MSADVIGVGSDGHTTWALHKGKADPTDTSSYPDFIGTGMLPDFFVCQGSNALAMFFLEQLHSSKALMTPL